MNADKKNAGRGLGGLGGPSPRPAVIVSSVSQDGRNADTATLHVGDKLCILTLANTCTAVAGVLLRTEGLSASNLTPWRRQHTCGML